MEPFRIYIADEVLDDLRARLRNTRWPDQVPGIGWKQGTDLNWLQQLVSFWADDFDWRAWEQRLNAFDHFSSQGIHFIYKRAASGSGLPLIFTHGWPGSFLDYLEMLPLLDDFDLVTLARSGARGASASPRTILSVPPSPSIGSHRRSHPRCVITGTIVGSRWNAPTPAPQRRLVSSRIKPFLRVSRRVPIWSACTTSSDGPCFRAVGTSHR